MFDFGLGRHPDSTTDSAISAPSASNESRYPQGQTLSGALASAYGSQPARRELERALEEWSLEDGSGSAERTPRLNGSAGGTPRSNGITSKLTPRRAKGGTNKDGDAAESLPFDANLQLYPEQEDIDASGSNISDDGVHAGPQIWSSKMLNTFSLKGKAPAQESKTPSQSKTPSPTLQADMIDADVGMDIFRSFVGASPTIAHYFPEAADETTEDPADTDATEALGASNVAEQFKWC